MWPSSIHVFFIWMCRNLRQLLIKFTIQYLNRSRSRLWSVVGIRSPICCLKKKKKKLHNARRPIMFYVRRVKPLETLSESHLWGVYMFLSFFFFFYVVLVYVFWTTKKGGWNFLWHANPSLESILRQGPFGGRSCSRGSPSVKSSNDEGNNPLWLEAKILWYVQSRLLEWKILVLLWKLIWNTVSTFFKD